MCYYTCSIVLAPLTDQFRNKFLPRDLRIVGYARTKMDNAEFVRRIRSQIKTPTQELEEQLDEFCGICSYISGQYDQDESFANLNEYLKKLEHGQTQKHRIFYMALPPTVFITVSQRLRKNCYPPSGIARIIVCYFPFPHLGFVTLLTARSKNHSVKTYRARVACKRHWRPTGRKTKSFGSTTIWVRKWSRTS